MEEKDLFDQKILHNDPASGFRKQAAGMMDALLVVGLMYGAGNYLLPAAFWNRISSESPLFLLLAFFLTYRILFILAAGATPGMFIARIGYLDRYYERPSLTDRLLAAIFIHHNGLAIYRRRPKSED